MTPEELQKEVAREVKLQDFNKGPTEGTLNDKRRLALIYETLLEVHDLLSHSTNTK